MPDDARGRVFSFGVFEVYEAQGELQKHGVPIKLHAQPFQLLLMLLERPSEVVTREEMRRRLWGEDTFVDFDHGLSSAVNKIREALQDSASRPRYVETVSGKGYRFIAPVSQVSGPRALTALDHAPAVSTDDGPKTSRGAVLSTPEELPQAPHKLVRLLLLLVETLYLGIYVTALANLNEVDEIFVEARMFPPAAFMAAVVTSAVVLIPVRLYLLAAVAFDLRDLSSKFARMFPVLLLLDVLWALSPFLLVHYISTSLALAMSAALVYLPFAQRSLVLMSARGR
jgi:DNA-binding winged helix-turn-helix (wHTH) protein